MIYFLSNHTDTSFIEKFYNDSVQLIKHPYIEPTWTTDEIVINCESIISNAVNAEKLVINGDYTLVSIILKRRWELGKKTGFIAMQKFNEPSNEKDENGKIIHKNILLPVSIREV